MIVVHLNGVYGSGSTGRIIYELTEQMAKRKDTSFTFYSEGSSISSDANRYISDFARNIHALLSRLTGLQGYFSIIPTIKLLQKMSRINPDIVHLHVLHGNSISLPMLFSYLKRKQIPVVVTLHDCWLVTGKCSYPTPYQCDHYTSDCSHCAAKHDVNPSWLFVPARKMHADRQKWFSGLTDYRFVGVSNWVANLARDSFPVNEKVSTIYNWIDERVFYPRDSNELKDQLHIVGKRVLLGVSSFWSTQKGLDDFLAISSQLPDTDCIVMVGRIPENLPKRPNILWVGTIENPEQLAAYYAMADVFVNPSQFETFGKTTAEALMCGTPVVAYANTATAEIIAPNCGILVTPSSGVDGLILAVNTVLQNSKASYTLACVTHAKQNFCMKVNIDQYFSLYQELLTK